MIDAYDAEGVIEEEELEYMNNSVVGVSQSGLEKLGWNRGEGDVLLINPTKGKVMQVAVVKPDGSPIYDQFLHAEPIGAITVPVNSKGEIGIITAWRWTADPDLYDYETIEDNLDIIGRESVEVPRGFPMKGEASAQTAAREGGEELGSPVTAVTPIGVVTANTAFNPHQIPVYLAAVDETFEGDIPGDVNESILKVTWVSPAEIFARIQGKEIYCGLTLSAIMLAFAHGVVSL